MKASEVNALAGERNKYLSISKLYKRLKARSWTYNGDAANLAGCDMRKGFLVHFTITKAVEPGCCSHRRIGVDLGDALDCISGNINPSEAKILL